MGTPTTCARTLSLLGALLLLSATAPASRAAPGDISTVAGGAGSGSALLLGQSPMGVAVSGSRVYVADAPRGVIRRIDTTTGVETVVAGNGASGFAGDGGPATAAELNYPTGVALDTAGDLFIADQDSSVVRKVDGTTGAISTVAGMAGMFDFTGDGGPATLAELNHPAGVALDGVGNLFIADSGNCVVRKVTATGTISTVAGTGGFCDFAGDGGLATAAALSSPTGVALDAAGDLFIADSSNCVVRKVTATTGKISTVAGTGGVCGFAGDGGAAKAAQLYYPTGVALDGTGNLFIADSGNCVIRKVATTGKISTVAGTGGACGFAGDGGAATAAQLNSPMDVALDSTGNLFIADAYNFRIRQVGATSHKMSTLAGNGTASFGGDGGAATVAELSFPADVVLGGSGDLFVVDQGNCVIRKVGAVTGTISTVAGTGGTCDFAGDGGPATAAELNFPAGAAFDGTGDLIIADQSNCVIRKVQMTTGTISTVAGTGGACGFAGDGGPATAAELYLPAGVALDVAGNLFIADQDNFVIRRVDAMTHQISTVAGTPGISGFAGDGGPATAAELSTTTGVALDGAGNLFIADTGNCVIRKVVAATGAISTVAGIGGACGFAGDGGAATAAELNVPMGFAFDATGKLFVADSSNERIRRVEATTTTTTQAPATTSTTTTSTSTTAPTTTSTTVTTTTQAPATTSTTSTTAPTTTSTTSTTVPPTTSTTDTTTTEAPTTTSTTVTTTTQAPATTSTTSTTAPTATSTTSTTVPPTTSTSVTTTTQAPSTTSTTASMSTTTTSATASTTTTEAPTTTTTTLPCITARCTLAVAQSGPECAGQTLPAGVTAKLARAEWLIDQAATGAARTARKLRKEARRALKQAGTKAMRASQGRRPQISRACAEALRNAAQSIVSGLEP